MGGREFRKKPFSLGFVTELYIDGKFIHTVGYTRTSKEERKHIKCPKTR